MKQTSIPVFSPFFCNMHSIIRISDIHMSMLSQSISKVSVNVHAIRIYAQTPSDSLLPWKESLSSVNLLCTTFHSDENHVLKILFLWWPAIDLIAAIKCLYDKTKLLGLESQSSSWIEYIYSFQITCSLISHCLSYRDYIPLT